MTRRPRPLTADPDPSLLRVEKEAAAVLAAVAAREDAIKAASRLYSLRDIAAAAGVSHQTVKNILDREVTTKEALRRVDRSAPLG